MKKVLIIQNILPQYRKEFFNQLKKELKHNNIILELIYGKAAKTDVLKKDEVDIDWANIINKKQFRIGKINLVWQPCLKYLNDKDLVIMEASNKYIVIYYLIIARYFSKFKLAFWGHGRNLQENHNSISNRFKYMILDKCDWWFAYTQGVKDFLISKGFQSNKITAVQNAIDTNSMIKYYSDISETEVTELIDELGIKGCKTAIFCGGMYTDKRLDFILDTCFKVKNKIPKFHMIFVGSGAESYKIHEASINHDWIHNVGPKFGHDRVKYFKIASIQLMPGIVGLGILDSFALETPIITTNYPFHSPEIEYLENGVNGIITNDNLTEYSDAIIDIIKNEKHLNLIENCKLSAKRFTVEKMVENFKAGILNCLNTI